MIKKNCVELFVDIGGEDELDIEAPRFAMAQ